MPVIVLIGPQGSGKGTQSEKLAAKLGVPHVSLGTLFRAEIRSGSELGQKLSSFVSVGALVPSDVAAQVLARRLTQPDTAAGAVLDGYPRTLEQADELENILAPLGKSLGHAVYLNVPDDEAMLRLSGRRVCTNVACERNYHLQYNPPAAPDVCDACGAALRQRDDDQPEVIRHRLDLYHRETVPLIELYKGLGVLREIDAHRSIEEVHADIVKAVTLAKED